MSASWSMARRSPLKRTIRQSGFAATENGCAPCTPSRSQAIRTAGIVARERSRLGTSERSERQQPREEVAIALERDSQVFGRHVVAAVPLTLEVGAFASERIGDSLDD